MRVGNYLDLTIKFHDYSSFFTAFDVASIIMLYVFSIFFYFLEKTTIVVVRDVCPSVCRLWK